MSDLRVDLKRLSEKLHFGITFDEPLSFHSGWRIGGNADCLVEPYDHHSLQGLVKYAMEKRIPYFAIGGGTNMLFHENGFRGIILKIAKHFSGYRISDNEVRSQAGVWVPCLAHATALAGLGGFEHIIGIPGNLGGLIAMNGGSLRKCISEFLLEVKYLDETGGYRTLSKEDCEFGYRRSVFQEGNKIITDAVFELHAKNRESINSDMLEILRKRNSKFPRKEPNCGSVFKNDPDLYEKFGPPGKVIEDLGLKGHRIGGAYVSPVHANFIINDGSATSGNIVELFHIISSRIEERTGLRLQSEIRFLGEEDAALFLHQIEQ